MRAVELGDVVQLDEIEEVVTPFDGTVGCC